MRDMTGDFEHDICMWDDTHIYASHPIRKPEHPLTDRVAISLDSYYSLNDHTKVRKEAYGCMVQNRDAYTVKCFDEEAYDLFQKLTQPTKGSDLLQMVNSDTKAVRFLEARIGDFTLKAFDSSPDKGSNAEFFDWINMEAPLSAPIAMEIEITRKCGRACHYCAYDSSPKVDTSGELTTQQWRSLLDQAHELGVFNVEFTGGDPMTRQDGFDVLSYADSLGFLYTVNSDLTNLTDAKVAELAQLPNLIAVQTTIDGPTAEIHDHYRGKGGYTLTVEGTKRLVGHGIPVAAGMIVSKFNYNHVGEVAQLCNDLGIAYFFVGGLYAAGRGSNMTKEVPSNEELACASQAYARAVFSGIVTPAHPSFLRHKAAFEASPETFNHLKDQPYIANSGNETLRVDPTGKCYVNIKYEDRSDFHVGDLTQEPLKSVWLHSQALKRLRKAYDTIGARNFNGIDIRLLDKVALQ